MNLTQRIEDILKAEAEAIRRVAVTDDYLKAVETLYACKTKVLTVGMGKAGLIAKKFAATLCSTGTPAVYVHPGEAAHGDLGIVAPDDCVVAFSTSGQTREVVEMLAMGRHLGLATAIGITSHYESPLRDYCDVILEMGIIEEPCPLGLTPTASTTVMMAIADSLALVLMEKKGITRADYGLRHHGGYLGRKARLNNQ